MAGLWILTLAGMRGGRGCTMTSGSGAHAVTEDRAPRPDEWIGAGGRTALEVYEWLKANGVDEWLPDEPDIYVAGGELTYTAWVWDGPRGWDMDHVRVEDRGGGPAGVFELRTVPLLVPLTDRVRELARRASPPGDVFRLFEDGIEVR